MKRGKNRLWGTPERFKPINRIAGFGVVSGIDEGRFNRVPSDRELIITQLLDRIGDIRKSSQWLESEKEKTKAQLKKELRKEFKEETKFMQDEQSKEELKVLLKGRMNALAEKKSKQLEDIRLKKLINIYDQIYSILPLVASNNSNLFKCLIDVFTLNIRDIWKHGKTTPNIDALFSKIQQLIKRTSPAIYELELAAIEGIRQQENVEES